MPLSKLVPLAIAPLLLSQAASAHILLRDFAQASLHLVSEAAVVGEALRVCPSKGYAKGAAWYPVKQRVADGFLTRFTFQFSQQVSFGGDGLAFVLQNQGSQAIGDFGGALGFSAWPQWGPDGIASCLAIELDMFANAEWSDPNHNHLSVQTGGDRPNCADKKHFSLGWTTDIPQLHNTEVHHVTIHYVPGVLRVYLDDAPQPQLTVSVDLAQTLTLDEGRAWVGFTAGTGIRQQNHDILNWIFVEQQR